MAAFDKVLILTGPTGSGKTRLGLELAERLGAEIVSMDSMALYRGMDLGTAKPTSEERRRVPHHLIDVLDPWESASVAWWLEQAARYCEDIRSRGRHVLFVGGAPLYLKALLRGLFAGPAADETLRARLFREAEESGPAALHARLARVDPVAAARLHPNDLRRLVRALEVWELTGRPISSWQTQWTREDETAASPSPPAEQGQRGGEQHSLPSSSLPPGSMRPTGVPSCLWLDVPRQELYTRINARVEHMFAEGLVNEVRSLLALPRPLSREARQALGYKEVLGHLEGRISLEETIELVKTRTRQYAKRQLTWFRHLPECRPATPELTWTLWGPTMEGSERCGERPASVGW